MHYKGIKLGIISALVGSSIAAPASSSSQTPLGLPLFTPSGNGNGNINLVLGGGIFPTLTIANALAGTSGQFVIGGSRTIGIGGGPFPTASIGGGGGVAVDPYDIVAQGSFTAGEGGWLSGAVPTLGVGGALNGNLNFQYSSGVTAGAGANGGGWASLGYGGIYLPSYNLIASGGGNFAVNVQNGPASPTSSSSSS
ncbi:hypothetical protein GGI25_002048 [Coemansia spiralis]|uniref:Uncharacterized protein n=2 Tax=Coemansia TaxID=4863 RepID=A0A9W8G9J4_9FUNG|nr:hypothetical protein GGI25_002048 [Coemansia spiralis]